MKLGVCLESLGLPFRAALATASRMGIAGVQMDAVGDLAPERLGETGRKELRHLLRSHGLEITAIHCPLRHGLDHPVNLQPRIERLMATLVLSFDLGARRVIIEAGRMPADDDPRGGHMREALLALSACADRVGSVLALETGLESGEAMASYLAKIGPSGLGVNYDPANLLVHGFDPVANLAPLRDWIVHTHARDAKMTSASRGASSVAIGHGDIEWMSYLGTLASQDYDGWVVVESDEPDVDAVEQGVNFLRRLI